MRVLIQNCKSKGYYNNGKWTVNAGVAQDFQSSQQAREFCLEQNLQDAKILLRFKDNAYDVELPVSPRQNSLIAQSERPAREFWTFALYISGGSAAAGRIVLTLRRFCEKFLEQNNIDYQIEVVDILKEPVRPSKTKIYVTPTLIWETAKKRRHLIGDFTEIDLFRFTLPETPGVRLTPPGSDKRTSAK